jgi:hypothetical protein
MPPAATPGVCALCGVPDASHDALLLRVALLATASGRLLLPGHWIRRAATAAGRGARGAARFVATRPTRHGPAPPVEPD